MMNAGVISGRTTSFIVAAAVLFYGNIAFVVNAFQATKFLQQPPSCSSSNILSRPFGDACIARSKLQNRQSRGNQAWLYVAVADTSTNNATASTDDNELGDGDAMIPPEVFFPPEESQYFDEEKEGFASTTKRGRKRRAIQRMRQNHFSRPIESRLARTLLFPMVRACLLACSSVHQRFRSDLFPLFETHYLTFHRGNDRFLNSSLRCFSCSCSCSCREFWYGNHCGR